MDITLKPAEGGDILNVSSMHPASQGLTTVVLKKRHDAGLVHTIQAFDIVVCNVDSEAKHVHMCGKDKEQEMLALEVQHGINHSRGAWHAAESERYQQRRVDMGLARLQPGEKRSHWDESMRLAYLERFGGTAYQAQREKDIAAQRADFLKIDADARREAITRRNGLAPSIAGKTLASLTVTYLKSDAVLHAVVLTLLHFFMLDCPLQDFVITDAISGQTWGLQSRLQAPTNFTLVQQAPGLFCCKEGFLPRDPMRAAAQATRHGAEGSEEVARLLGLGLSDAEVETATRRFYSGQTFLQYIIESNDLFENSAAVAYACLADMNGSFGDTSPAIPVFFVLVQVMMNLELEFHRTPLDPATGHIRDFFASMWVSYTRLAASCVENEKYLYKGMTLVQYTDALKGLLVATLEAHESEFLLSCF